MLRSLKDLEGYVVSATDGQIGKVRSFLFDDEQWVVRHLVVETGNFFNERRVLISPLSIREAYWSDRTIHLALTVDKIQNSPSVDVDKPVSRQHEGDYYRYYGYPAYWGVTGGVLGKARYPGAMILGDEPPARDLHSEPGDTHLRSLREVCGYQILGSDEAIGHVADLVVDDESWTVRYLVIETGHWWSGRKVLVAPHWATRFNWSDQSVDLDLTRKAIQGSPALDPSVPVDRKYEAHLHDYYGRPIYWAPHVEHEATQPSRKRAG